MNLLFIGDIVGRPGRELVRKGLAALVEHHGADLVIANVENAAAGFGITKDIGDAFLGWGVDVMTSGNHVWDKKEALEYIAGERRLLRPANYPAGAPGRGSFLAQTGDGRAVGVVNVMGRVFMTPIDERTTQYIWMQHRNTDPDNAEISERISAGESSHEPPRQTCGQRRSVGGSTGDRERRSSGNFE